jgi:Glyoxalase/Bleomycin resistance protein/Dioxygenase superfamily
MVQTHGLTHINLAVRDLGRTLRFYEQVFGLHEYGRGDGLVHTKAFGRHDIVTFVEDAATAGLSGALHISAFGSSIPTTSTVPSPRWKAPEGGCSVVASSLPASLTLTLPIRMATKLRSGSNELPLPPNQAMQLTPPALFPHASTTLMIFRACQARSPAV